MQRSLYETEENILFQAHSNDKTKLYQIVTCRIAVNI